MTILRNSLLTSLFGILLFPSFSAMAQKGKNHAAHEHGAAEVNIVVDGQKATIQIHTPAESIYGFEHEAKTEADKKKRDKAIEVLKSQIDKIVLFDSKLGCKFSPTKIDPFVTEASENQPKSAQKKEAEHSAVEAEFAVECSAPLAGTKVKFGLTKIFSRIKNAKVTVLSGEKQSGATIKKDIGTIDL